MLDFIPGIFEKDAGELTRKMALIAPYTDWVHIDVADGTLVPATTFTDFAFIPDLLKKVSPDRPLLLEAHLMVARPHKYIKPLVDAGFSRLIAHVECEDPREFLRVAKFEEVEVALAIDGPTEIELIEPFVEEIDTVLVMTVEMGASSMPFLPEAVEKIKALHEYASDLVIEVDGGITPDTAKLVKEAGALRLSATHYIWDHVSDLAQAIKNIHEA